MMVHRQGKCTLAVRSNLSKSCSVALEDKLHPLLWSDARYGCDKALQAGSDNLSICCIKLSWIIAAERGDVMGLHKQAVMAPGKLFIFELGFQGWWPD